MESAKSPGSANVCHQNTWPLHYAVYTGCLNASIINCMNARLSADPSLPLPISPPSARPLTGPRPVTPPRNSPPLSASPPLRLSTSTTSPNNTSPNTTSPNTTDQQPNPSQWNRMMAMTVGKLRQRNQRNLLLKQQKRLELMRGKNSGPGDSRYNVILNPMIASWTSNQKVRVHFLPDSLDTHGRTPLMLAVVMGQPIRFVEDLLNAGASLYACDQSKFSVIHHIYTRRDPILNLFVQPYERRERAIEILQQVEQNSEWLSNVGPFYVELTIHYHSFPMNRLSPSHLRIYKKGTSIRVDCLGIPQLNEHNKRVGGQVTWLFFLEDKVARVFRIDLLRQCYSVHTMDHKVLPSDLIGLQRMDDIRMPRPPQWPVYPNRYEQLQARGRGDKPVAVSTMAHSPNQKLQFVSVSGHRVIEGRKCALFELHGLQYVHCQLSGHLNHSPAKIQRIRTENALSVSAEQYFGSEQGNDLQIDVGLRDPGQACTQPCTVGVALAANVGIDLFQQLLPVLRIVQFVSVTEHDDEVAVLPHLVAALELSQTYWSTTIFMAELFPLQIKLPLTPKLTATLEFSNAFGLFRDIQGVQFRNSEIFLHDALFSKEVFSQNLRREF